jgi:hypothetical protein
MTVADVTFQEAREVPHFEAIPLAHLSIEVGHLYREDLETQGPDDRLRKQFAQAKHYIDAAVLLQKARYGKRARISTCFRIDDYSPPDIDPAPVAAPREAVRLLTETARAHGFQLDYIARESGCVSSTDRPRAGEAEHVRLVEIVAGQLVPEPVEGTTGFRPTASESGWLCNGRRSPVSQYTEAASSLLWEAPEEYGYRNHSVFLDAQLWTDVSARDQYTGQIVVQRNWSCVFLEAIWQMLRLGLLRDEGKAVAKPYLWTEDDWPEDWMDMPTVTQVNPGAADFAAYRAVSVLPSSYLEIEHAVRTVLNHVLVDSVILTEIVDRAAREDISIPRSPIGRISHVFLDSD